VILLKKSYLLILTSIVIFIFSSFFISYINSVSKERIKEYSTMIASKVTKYVVNAAYNDNDFEMTSNNLYEILKGSDGDIKTIIYDTAEVNELLNIVTSNVYENFNKLESKDLKDLNIRENILISDSGIFGNGIILEVPLGIVTNNYLLASLGPRIPVKISLTGEFESQLSTEVKEYGINNALISLNIDIRVTEQITMPFITEKIIIENQIPVTINLVNGKIPNYYLNGFEKTSSVYKMQ